MSDTLGILYELRACFSRFDERQAPYYRALSEAIETMHNLSKQRKGGNMRLIDADAVANHLKERLIETALNNVGIMANADDVYREMAENRIDVWIDEIPTVDTVPVIRCKDCASCEDFHSGTCSLAERRQDG